MRSRCRRRCGCSVFHYRRFNRTSKKLRNSICRCELPFDGTGDLHLHRGKGRRKLRVAGRITPAALSPTLTCCSAHLKMASGDAGLQRRRAKSIPPMKATASIPSGAAFVMSFSIST
jgi:hypothetical protein